MTILQVCEADRQQRQQKEGVPLQELEQRRRHGKKLLGDDVVGPNQDERRQQAPGHEKPEAPDHAVKQVDDAEHPEFNLTSTKRPPTL